MEHERSISLASEYYTDKNVQLGHITGLTEREQAAFNSLQMVQKFVTRDADIVLEGDAINRLMVVREGWAIRYLTMPDGRRQIHSFVLPGDLVCLHLDLNKPARHGVASITPCKIVEIDGSEVAHAIRSLPNLVEALNWYVARELVILADQSLRLGRMTAFERVCHLLLELWYRQYFSGDVGEDQVAQLPVTQAIIADTLGLSVVHVNRQVMKLRRDGLVTISRRKLKIQDRDKLREITGFKPEHVRPLPKASDEI